MMSSHYDHYPPGLRGRIPIGVTLFGLLPGGGGIAVMS